MFKFTIILQRTMARVYVLGQFDTPCCEWLNTSVSGILSQIKSVFFNKGRSLHVSWRGYLLFLYTIIRFLFQLCVLYSPVLSLIRLFTRSFIHMPLIIYVISATHPFIYLQSHLGINNNIKTYKYKPSVLASGRNRTSEPGFSFNINGAVVSERSSFNKHFVYYYFEILSDKAVPLC